MGGRMMRSCEECRCSSMGFDDRLGEWVCDICGYVQVENFEETTVIKHHTTHEKLHDGDGYGYVNPSQYRNFTAHEEGYMILGEFVDSENIRTEFRFHYNNLNKNHMFKGKSIIERCAGLAYFTLKANNVMVDVNSISKSTDISKKKIIRMAKRIATYFGKPDVLFQYNPEADIDKVRYELELSFEFASDVKRVYYALAHSLGDVLDTKRKRFMAGVIWLTLQIRGETGRNRVSMQSLAMALKNNKSKATISYGYRDILNAIRLNRQKVEEITIEQLIEGAW
jgi:hypothetical protein